MEIPELPHRTHSDAVTVESLADGVGIAADNEVFRRRGEPGSGWRRPVMSRPNCWAAVTPGAR